MSAAPAPTALVTGAGGFIGSHLADELVRRGWRVRALCRDHARHDLGALSWLSGDVLGEVEVCFGDLRDVESVLDVVGGMEVIFHLGAQIAIPYSYINPRAFFETNVLGSLNVARAAQASGVERLLHVSTSEVYGSAQRLPITESHPISPQSPYAASKVGADALMGSYHLSFGLPVAIVRPFNTYGPHQSARAVIPTVISQALFSDRVRLGSLTPRRDFTYVSDIVAGMIAVALEGRAVGRTVQIGSGESHSVGEIVQLVGQLLGHELEVETEDRRVRPAASEVQELLCDSALAAELTGWSATVPLSVGLEQTADWIRSDPRLWKVDQYAI
jgi:dTDP-glucose 4,6-dehydratase